MLQVAAVTILVLKITSRILQVPIVLKLHALLPFNREWDLKCPMQVL